MSQVEPEPMEDEAPDTIRAAVRQLKTAYDRCAAVAAQPRLVPAPGAAQETVQDGLANGPQEERFSDALRRAEAVLFAAGEPLSAAQVAEALPPGEDPARVLMALKGAYANRGVQLVEVAGKWRFQTARDLSFLFVEERRRQKRLGQAALETLAIIAYGQPVSRAEIEAVRGVAVSKTTIDTLLECGWIKVKGRRRTPGRPVVFGTTDSFLEYFGLEGLETLPGKADLDAEGLLSNVMPEDFEALGDADAGESVDEAGETDSDDSAFVTDFMARDGGDGAEDCETD